MEEKSSDEDSSNLESQSASPKSPSGISPKALPVTNGDTVNKARAALGASTGVSPSPKPNREIVLVLKPPEATNNPQGPDQAEPPAPEPQFRSSGETQAQVDEKFCIRIWVLWAALTCPLIFAMWLFLVPFMVSKSSKSTTPVPASVTTSMATCTKPVTLAAPKPPIRINPHPDRGPSKQPVRPFFCLFRNTAVTFSRNYSTVSSNYDYTFWTIPFDLCHYVIYWSVAIDNGNINSRMPHFDQHHGLYQMRNITDSLGFPNVKLLLALGGYAEDGPHFSILGREPAILNRLTANVVDAMTSLRLDGVAVHWVDPGAHCRGPNDQETVAALLRMLRQAFDSNQLTQAIVTAMLDGDSPMERLVYTSKDAVKYFFLTADRRTLSSGSKVLFEVCSALSDKIMQTMTHYIDSVPGLRWAQICPAEPVAALASDGDVDITTQRFTPQPGSVLRWAPIYEACGSPSFCRLVGVSQSCIVHYMNVGSRSLTRNVRAVTVYFNDVTYTLRARFSARAAVSISGEPCTFATLTEYDNYAGQCGGRYNRHLLLRHLYFGTIGQYLYNGSIEDAAPFYDPATC